MGGPVLGLASTQAVLRGTRVPRTRGYATGADSFLLYAHCDTVWTSVGIRGVSVVITAGLTGRAKENV